MRGKTNICGETIGEVCATFGTAVRASPCPNGAVNLPSSMHLFVWSGTRPEYRACPATGLNRISGRCISFFFFFFFFFFFLVWVFLIVFGWLLTTDASLLSFVCALHPHYPWAGPRGLSQVQQVRRVHQEGCEQAQAARHPRPVSRQGMLLLLLLLLLL